MIKFNLTSQLNRNIASGAIVHGLNIIVALISYPIFIHYLKFELFSVWTLLSVIVSFAQVGDLGISKAVIFYTAKAKSELNLEGIRELLTSAILILTILSLIIQILLWIFKTNIIHFLSIPSQYYEQSFDVIPLIGLCVFTYLIYDSLSGIITGFGRLDLSNLLLLLLNILKILLTISFLAVRSTLISMAIGIIISNLLFILIAIYIVSGKRFISKFPIAKHSKATCYKIFKFGFPVLGVQVFNILMFPLIKIIIAKFFNVNFVGYFELASKAAYSMRTFFEKGLFALLPEFSSLHKIESHSGLLAIKSKVDALTKKLVYLSIPIFILFCAISPWFLKIWLGVSYNSEVLWAFLLLQPGVIAGLLALPSYYALLATYNQDKCLYEAMIRTILSVSLIFLFILFFSIHSFIIYTAISLSVIISNSYIIFSFRNKIKNVS